MRDSVRVVVCGDGETNGYLWVLCCVVCVCVCVHFDHFDFIKFYAKRMGARSCTRICLQKKKKKDAKRPAQVGKTSIVIALYSHTFQESNVRLCRRAGRVCCAQHRHSLVARRTL